MWKRIVRPLLFRLPAERAHDWSMRLLSLAVTSPGVAGWMRRRWRVDDPRLVTRRWGLTFRNPVGLAAGFDKDARWLAELALLGFGSIEVGSVTGQGQSGNPPPRLFRLVEDQAILNRMGFNNQGAEAMARRLRAVAELFREQCVLGINLGKTKTVPLERAGDDYERSFRALYSFGDYFVVNVSSPNTPGLRTLQDRAPLEELLQRLGRVNRELTGIELDPADQGVADLPEITGRKPLLIKIAPDVNDQQLDEILEVVQSPLVDGVIATNTTTSRAGLRTDARRVAELGEGGLSGRPLFARSCEVVARLYDALQGAKPIVGVGGIFSGADAWRMICLGASFVQIYTGMIYEGPGLAARINRYLLDRLERHGLNSIAHAVGRRDWLELSSD